MKDFKRRVIATLLTMTMVLAGIVVTPSTAKAAGEVIDIQILATSDLHGRFVPYDMLSILLITQEVLHKWLQS